MAPAPLMIPDSDRATLTRMTVSRRTPRGQSARAHIVLACAEGTLADAAQRCGVSPRTAGKWKHRYERYGIDGLIDAPRSGRPATPDDAVHQTLTCVLREPPPGGWTTRSIAAATGLSQSTVCRIRRDNFPGSGEEAVPELAEHSAILAFAHVGPDVRVLAFHSPVTAPEHRPARQSSRRAATTALEAVLCAALVADRGLPAATPSVLALLRRAVAEVPAHRAVTVVLDVVPEGAAVHWLRRHPRVDVAVVAPGRWLGQLHRLAGIVDSRQLPELTELAGRIRTWHRDAGGGAFEWTRSERIFDDDGRQGVHVDDIRSGRRPSVTAVVVRGLCEAIADTTMSPGGRINARVLAARVQLSSATVSDALRQLAEDGLVDQDAAGRFVVPTPTERDVLETYTARGLLGTAIVRRLAGGPRPLPEAISDLFDDLVACAGRNDIAACGSLDLDVQDELARAAQMPRIEAMFVRLTLQLRLFVTLMGLNYEYPVDDIVADDSRILDTINAHDVEGSVAAWRSKTDNCARYMMGHIDQRPRR